MQHSVVKILRICLTRRINLNSLSTQQAEFRPTSLGVNRIAVRLAAGILAITLGGCAATAPRSAEVIVKERAQARWDALVKSDINAAYGYLSPGSRAVTSVFDYAG